MTAQRTGIEWTDAVWNPVTGCSKVSTGCKHCYAETLAERFWGARKFTDVQCHDDRLDAPLKWRKPRRVFVNSMSDLFHGDVPDEFIAKVFDVIRRCRAEQRGHTFQVLTKRPRRMRDVMRRLRFDGSGEGRTWIADRDDAAGYPLGAWHLGSTGLDNVWLGVSCEDQAAADERIPLLLRTPAAVRFVSAEPLLGPVKARFLDLHAVQDDDSCANWCDACARRRQDDIAPDTSIDWVIVGGESGPHARPCDVAWIRSIVEQCKAASVPCFVKQLGALPIASFDPPAWVRGDRPNSILRIEAAALAGVHHPKGGDPSEWPEDLRVREMPRASQA